MKCIIHTEKNCFLSMFQKHGSKLCSCVKNNKLCNTSGIIDLQKSNDINYINNLYNLGIIDGIYNICQSVTQSLKSTAGADLEIIISRILNTHGIYHITDKLNIFQNQVLNHI